MSANIYFLKNKVNYFIDKDLKASSDQDISEREVSGKE